MPNPNAHGKKSESEHDTKSVANYAADTVRDRKKRTGQTAQFRPQLCDKDEKKRGKAISYFLNNTTELKPDDRVRVLELLQFGMVDRKAAVDLLEAMLDHYRARESVTTPIIQGLRAQLKVDRSQSVREKMSDVLLRFPRLCERVDLIEREDEKKGLESLHSLHKLSDEVEKLLDRRRAKYGELIAGMAGLSLESYEANRKMMDVVNHLRTVLGMQFQLHNDKQKRKVSVRVTQPQGSLRGSFQAISSVERKTVYTGPTFPQLVARVEKK